MTRLLPACARYLENGSRLVWPLLAVLVLCAPLPARATEPGETASFLRWGYYVPWDPASFDSLQQHLADLDIVALHWASLDQDGVMHLEEQAHVRSLLHEFDGKMLPSVINHGFEQEVAHLLLTEPEVRERGLAALAELGNRWDGVVLDFEDLAPTDRDAYTAFVGELRARLGPDKLLAVAVPARTEDTGRGWAGGFDYRGLAESSDLVFLMAYGFRTIFSSTAGPTAPLWWIEAVLQHALTEIPHEKLILGLPAYGHDWAHGEPRPQPPARTVVYSSALDLAARHGVSIEYDWTLSGARFSYLEGEQEREVWFEDALTLDQKLALVERLGLAGAGWWRLGGEDPATWSAVAARHAGGRFFPETGYAITTPEFLDYFHRRGEESVFGYPVSAEFRLLGTRVQLFQRAAMQVGPQGEVGLLNLLDPGLLPLQQANFSTFPAFDPAVLAQAPPIDAPDYGERVVDWLRLAVPEEWEGEPVGFQRAYFGGLDCDRAFPDEPCREELLPLMALEIWGLPTSMPVRDPENDSFVYQRFQRGILHYDSATGTTQGLLVGDYFKALLTGHDLPPDLEQNQRDSPLLRQYDPSAPLGLARPELLPATNLRGAFAGR